MKDRHPYSRTWSPTPLNETGPLNQKYQRAILALEMLRPQDNAKYHPETMTWTITLTESQVAMINAVLDKG